MGTEKEASTPTPTPTPPAEVGKASEPKEKPTAQQANAEDKVDENINGVFDHVKDSDVDWGMAQLLAGGLLIGLGVAWYVRRRCTAEHSKYAE